MSSSIQNIHSHRFVCNLNGCILQVVECVDATLLVCAMNFISLYDELR